MVMFFQQNFKDFFDYIIFRMIFWIIILLLIWVKGNICESFRFQRLLFKVIVFKFDVDLDIKGNDFLLGGFRERFKEIYFL